MKTYVSIGSGNDENLPIGGGGTWTINSHAEPGDCVLIYLKAPISAFVAIARVQSKVSNRRKVVGYPKRATASILVEQKIHLKLEEARAELPEWKMLHNQISHALVPVEVAEKFFGLVGMPQQEQDSIPIPQEIKNALRGAGFGTPEQNCEVETAAITLVREHYEREGWSVKDCQSDRCGYDFKCTRGQTLELVEVKGVSGSVEAFIITSREHECAKENANYVLYIVTHALTKPHAVRYSQSDLLKQFHFREIAYTATKRK